MDKEKLEKTITGADIPRAEKDLLLRRLKVGSHEGVAHVVRDFQEAVLQKRREVCQSHRRYSQGLMPRNKLCFVIATK